MPVEIKNKLLVKLARQEWINAMTHRYPGFNAKRWEKDSGYRNAHPQRVIA